MPETTQQLAYIPMIFPDADFSRSEINSLPLIQSIDKSVKELNQNFYEQKQETAKMFASVDKDIADLKRDVGILKNDVTELKTALVETRAELKGDINTLSARADGIDKRLDDMNNSQNKWFMVLGFLVAAVPIAVAVVQNFIGH
ncbi:MAG: hypothetical protein IJ859_00250 [Synergistaceae bacterium]|nr:hypothetical protein [Synergistaceae bacterium]